MAISNHKQVRYDKVFYLQKKTSSQDEIGNPVYSVVESEVMGREVNVGSAEFYNAAAVGIKPEKQLETYAALYNGEETLRYIDHIYRVIRTRGYGDKVLLTCERVTGQ